MPVTTTLEAGGLHCPSCMPHTIYIAQAWAPPFPCLPRAWIGSSAEPGGHHHQGSQLTVIWTASRPSPASLASMVNSTGRLAGTPVVLSPGPLAFTLLASCVGSTLTLKGLLVGPACCKQSGSLSMPSPPPRHPRQGTASYLRGTSSSPYSTEMLYGPSRLGT